MDMEAKLHGLVDWFLYEMPIIRQWRERRFEKIFSAGNSYLIQRGVFGSFADAQASAPPAKPLGYNNEDAVRVHEDRISRMYPSDYPVMFWLKTLLSDGATQIFDLGGNIGVAYYSWQRYMRFPETLRWLVCDVPAVIDHGAVFAREHDQSRRLLFTDNIFDANGKEVLLACGVLQFLPENLYQSLAKLDRPPKHLLLNSVATHPSEQYFTLQLIYGTFYCPYKIQLEFELIKGLENLGYILKDRWDVLEKRCEIPFVRPDYSRDHFQGFYFSLRDFT